MAVFIFQNYVYMYLYGMSPIYRGGIYLFIYFLTRSDVVVVEFSPSRDIFSLFFFSPRIMHIGVFF